MANILKMFMILVVFSFVSVACSNSSEKFITVGEYYEYDDEYCPGDYYRTFPKTAPAAALSDDKDENGIAERYIAESKIYKIEDNILWLLHDYKGLIAIDISDPENMKILDSIKVGQDWLGSTMYFQDGKAYILVSSHEYEIHQDVGVKYYFKNISKLFIVDTTDPEHLAILGEFKISGGIADSKQAGDIIYLVQIETAEDLEYCNGEIGGTTGSDQFSIVSINIKDPQNIKFVDKVSLDGLYYTPYFSQKSIYVAETDEKNYHEEYKKHYSITMFDISDPEGKIVKKAVFQTDGFVRDNLKMYENGNTFFTVTSTSRWGDYNGVTSTITSFDVSVPENIRQIDRVIFNSKEPVKIVKFEHDRLYAFIPDKEAGYNSNQQLYIFDISDPAEIKEFSKIEISDLPLYLDASGIKLFTAVENENGGLSVTLYNVADPENPQRIDFVNFVQIPDISGEIEIDYNDGRTPFQIFDEFGLILYPIEFRESWGPYIETTYKLYIIDFDIDKGFRKLGSIKLERGIKSAAATNDFVFSIENNRIVPMDIQDRNSTKILPEFPVATKIEKIKKCGTFPCIFKDLKLTVYDRENLGRIWESTPPSDDDHSASMIQNSNYGYIFFTKDQYYGDNNPDFEGISLDKDASCIVKTVKFSDDGTLKETGDFPFKTDSDYYTVLVSENNVMAIRGTKYTDYNGACYKRQPKIMFFDMNNPKGGIKGTDFDFDYKIIDSDDDLFVNGTTVWASGCKLKQKNKNDEELAEYYCYAFPFDISDPKNPKAGKKINIPGELVGVSDDGKYLYSQTPSSFVGRFVSDEDCYPDYYVSDFYILKLNNDRTAVEIVRKESLEDSVECTRSQHNIITNTVSSEKYIKNDKVFFAKKTKNKEFGMDLSGCYEYDEHYDLSIFSAEKEEMVSLESSGKISGVYNVKNGGVLVNTEKGFKYIDENGKSQIISDDFNFTNIYIQDSQLINGKIYIPVGWDGIYTVDVK